MLTNHIEIAVPDHVINELRSSGYAFMTNHRGQECVWNYYVGSWEMSFVQESLVDPMYSAGASKGAEITVNVNIDSQLIEGAMKKALAKGAADFTEELMKL